MTSAAVLLGMDCLQMGETWKQPWLWLWLLVSTTPQHYDKFIMGCTSGIYKGIQPERCGKWPLWETLVCLRLAPGHHQAENWFGKHWPYPSWGMIRYTCWVLNLGLVLWDLIVFGQTGRICHLSDPLANVTEATRVNHKITLAGLKNCVILALSGGYSCCNQVLVDLLLWGKRHTHGCESMYGRIILWFKGVK